jgi:hypothetical protein
MAYTNAQLESFATNFPNSVIFVFPNTTGEFYQVELTDLINLIKLVQNGTIT